MKPLHLFLFPFYFILASCGNGVALDDLELRNGSYFEKNSSQPYTGEIDGLYSNSNFYGHKTNLVVKAEGFMKRGVKSGLWKEWYTFSTDVKYFEGLYENGKEEGIHTWWHQNETLKATGKYKRGLRIGVYKEYYESGKKKLRLNYKENLLHGIQSKWSPSGEKTMKEIYEAGVLVCSIVYGEAGKVLKQKGKCEKLINSNNQAVMN